MKTGQMFPRKTFNAEDLEAFNPDGITVVTIRELTYKTGEARNIGEAKIDYYLKCDELKKPLRLNMTSVGQIEAALGSDETDDWIGRRLGMQPMQWPVPNPKGGKSMVWVLNFYRVADDAPPSLPMQTDLTGYAGWTDGEKRRLQKMLPAGSGRSPTTGAGGGKDAAPVPMGAETAARMIVRLRERGLSWSNLEAYCKNQGRPELISGMMPADCPAELLPIAKVFYSTTPVVEKCPDIDKAVADLVAGWEPEPAAAKAEVIDKTTGEVIDTDDIPF